MPPALEVVDFRTAQLSAQTVAVADAQVALATVDSELHSARQALQAETDDLAALQQAETAIRSALARAAMPADVDQLEQDLEANLLAQGPQAAAVAEKQDALAKKSLERQRASAAVDRERQRFAEVGAAAVLAARDGEQATTWRAALAGTAVPAMVTEAGSAPVTTLVSDATSKLKIWLGKPALFDLLSSRYDDAVSAAKETTDAAQRATAALAAVVAEKAPADGEVVAKGDTFAEQRQAVASVVELGAQRLQWARGILSSVTAPSPVTPSEQARIDERATEVVASPNAATREKAVHVAAIEARGAAAVLEALTLPKMALDPDYDATTDSSVDTERTAAETKATNLQAKKDAFLPADKARIDVWEVALPAALTTLATDIFRALAIIDWLKALVPADLLNALDTAEDEYADALKAQDELQGLLEAAAAQAAGRLDDASVLAPVADVRVAASVRGDQ